MATTEVISYFTCSTILKFSISNENKFFTIYKKYSNIFTKILSEKLYILQHPYFIKNTLKFNATYEDRQEIFFLRLLNVLEFEETNCNRIQSSVRIQSELCS